LEKSKLFSFLKDSRVWFFVVICFIPLTALIYAIIYPNENITIQEKEVNKDVEKSKTSTEELLLFLNSQIDPDVAKLIASAVDKASEKHMLPRKLICSIIKKESNMNPFAISKAGASGLMQVMPKIHSNKLEGKNVFHIGPNVDVGCSIFREYLNKENGELSKTFHAYLSKNASKEVADAYQSDIMKYWAELEMYDYLRIIDREKLKHSSEENKEQNGTMQMEPSGT